MSSKGTVDDLAQRYIAVCADRDELRAENERLQGELMDASPGDLAQARDHAAHLELAIEKTWRPEVKALRAENERLRVALYEIERMPFGFETEVHAIALAALDRS